MATKRPSKRKAPGKPKRAKKKKAPAKPRKATEQKAPRKRRATKKKAAAKSKRASAKSPSTKRAAPKKRTSKKRTSKRAAPKKRASSKANGAKKRSLKRVTKRRVLGATPSVEPQAARPVEPGVTAAAEPAAKTPSSAPPSIKQAVAAYMNKLPDPHGALGSHFRKIVSTAAVGVDGAIKWAHDDWKDPHGVLHGASEKAASVRDLLKQAVNKRRSEPGRGRR